MFGKIVLLLLMMAVEVTGLEQHLTAAVIAVGMTMAAVMAAVLSRSAQELSVLLLPLVFVVKAALLVLMAM